MGTAQPNNTAPSTSYGWVGQHEKKSETDLALKPIQMGERIYLPSIGRFASVDPVEGGTANNYVYPPDPVGDFDLSGQFGMKDFANVASVGSMIPGPIGMASAAVSAAAYAKAGDKKNAVLMASGIALAAVGGTGAVKAYQAAKVVKTTNAARKASPPAKKLSEQLALKMVKSNPRAGAEIMRGKINDPKYRRALGWRKMEHIHRPLTDKGKQVVVHYFYNKYTRSVKQIKVKR